MLAKDWLKERGWKVYGSFRTFTRFTKVYRSFKRLTKRQRHFIKNFLICDFYTYKKEREEFAIVEVKSTQRRTNTFDFASEDQRKYYEKALELGIPIKFIFIKILDNKVSEIKMCSYPEDLAIFERKVRPMKEIEPEKKPIRKGITKKMLKK